MPIADFASLCQGVCEIAGVSPPALTTDARGTVAFTLRVREVDVSVMQFRAGDAAALLLAELGGVPQESAVDAWLALMHGNAALPGGDAPRFSRNPRTGVATLQWPCTLAELNPTDIYERISCMADVALRWSREPVPRNGSEAFYTWLHEKVAQPMFDDGAAARAAAQFHALHREISEAAGLPAQVEPPGGGTHGFPLVLNGFDVAVAHSVRQNRGKALVAVRLQTAAEKLGLAQLESMMDANYVMGLEPNGAILCREPVAGEVVLQYTYPLDAPSAADFLGQVTGIVAVARAWRESMATA